MQWQGNIRILGVFSDNTGYNSQIYFSNELGVVGWRSIQNSDSSEHAAGLTSMVAIAVAAQFSGRICQMLITNDGQIVAIATI
jgi:hypothetical protein